MLTVFLYTFMCYGLSSALVYYSGPFNIFSKFREFVSANNNHYMTELFSCMFCLPVNIGILMSVLSMLFTPAFPFTPFTLLFKGYEYLCFLIILFDGFYTGAAVSIIDSVVERINQTQVNVEDKIVLND